MAQAFICDYCGQYKEGSVVHRNRKLEGVFKGIGYFLVLTGYPDLCESCLPNFWLAVAQSLDKKDCCRD